MSCGCKKAVCPLDSPETQYSQIIDDQRIRLPVVKSWLRARFRASKAYRRFRPQLKTLLSVDRYGRVWLWKNLRARLARGVIWPVIKSTSLLNLTIFEQR